jgi:Transglutaminase-like superfamily
VAVFCVSGAQAVRAKGAPCGADGAAAGGVEGRVEALAAAAARRAGAAEDLATLLVALLRAAGLVARLVRCESVWRWDGKRRERADGQGGKACGQTDRTRQI